jgi:hypothetical protein
MMATLRSVARKYRMDAGNWCIGRRSLQTRQFASFVTGESAWTLHATSQQLDDGQAALEQTELSI